MVAERADQFQRVSLFCKEDAHWSLGHDETKRRQEYVTKLLS